MNKNIIPEKIVIHITEKYLLGSMKIIYNGRKDNKIVSVDFL